MKFDKILIIILRENFDCFPLFISNFDYNFIDLTNNRKNRKIEKKCLVCDLYFFATNGKSL